MWKSEAFKNTALLSGSVVHEVSEGHWYRDGGSAKVIHDGDTLMSLDNRLV